MTRANRTALSGLLILSALYTATAAAAPAAKKPAASAKKPAASTTSPAAALNKRLFDAIRAKDGAKVKLLIASGAKVNAKDPDLDMTPLILAATLPDTGVISALLEGGANVTDKTKDGITPLHVLAGFGKPDQIQMLLERGADVNARANDGQTPMFSAVHGDPQNIQLLLDHGAKINETDQQGNTPLVALAQLTDRTTPRIEAARFLIQKGAYVNGSASKETLTPLHAAARQDNLELVKLLLTSGADVDRPGPEGVTPLVAAAYFGRVEVLKTLLAAKANVNAAATDGATALVMAFEGETDGLPQDAADKARRREMMRLLLDSGADVNSPSPEQKVTLLMLAAAKGDANVVQLLLSKHADVNARTTDGYTALKLAAKAKQARVIALLKQAGAKQ